MNESESGEEDELSSHMTAEKGRKLVSEQRMKRYARQHPDTLDGTPLC